MFRIEEADGEKFKFSRMVVIDHDRDAAVQYVTTYVMDIPKVYVLFWQDRIIPFCTIRKEMKDPNNGEVYFQSKFYTFGFNNVAEAKENLKEYKFKNKCEATKATLLAIEAMLIYGSYYDGDKRPDGYDRFLFDGKNYTKKDFMTA